MRVVRPLIAAQTIPAPGDVDRNLAAHLALCELAAGEQAQVVVFPELSLTGYELDRAEQLAFTPDDPRLADLRAAAAAHRLTVVAGAPLRSGDRLHIAALILRADGGVDIYTKHHLGCFR